MSKSTLSFSSALQKGFGVIETMIVVAVVSSGIGMLLHFQGEAEKRQDSNASLISNASAAVTPAAPEAPSASAKNKWSNAQMFVSSTNFFGVSTSVPDAFNCVKLATSLADNGYRVTVSKSIPKWSETATTADKFLPAGNGVVVAKKDADDEYDPVVAATGCSEDTRFVNVAYN